MNLTTEIYWQINAQGCWQINLQYLADHHLKANSPKED